MKEAIKFIFNIIPSLVSTLKSMIDIHNIVQILYNENFSQKFN